MGFDWDANVSVRYVQRVEWLEYSYSRFATRCLKLQARPGRKRAKRLPGEKLTEKELEEGCPFSDTEEEVAAMSPDHQKLYTKIKDLVEGDHSDGWEVDGILNYTVGDDLINNCFKAAVERLLPGHGSEFCLCLERWGGSHGEVAEGAEREMMYILYKPSHCYAGGGLDVPRGGMNVPWGHKLTPVPVLDRDERVLVDASFAILVDKLGLKAIGEPGHMLITGASLG